MYFASACIAVLRSISSGLALIYDKYKSAVAYLAVYLFVTV